MTQQSEQVVAQDPTKQIQYRIKSILEAVERLDNAITTLDEKINNIEEAQTLMDMDVRGLTNDLGALQDQVNNME
jgi:prefoldin subunit 5